MKDFKLAEFNSDAVNVLHFFRSIWPERKGGIEKQIFDLSASTKALGINNHLVSLSAKIRGSVYGSDPFNTIALFPSTFRFNSADISVPLLFKFRDLVERADVVHFHFPDPMGELLSLFSLGDKPYVVTYHSDIVRQNQLRKVYSPIIASHLNRASKIIATSPNYLNSSKTLLKYKSKVSVIPIGIEIPELSTFCSEGGVERPDWLRALPPAFFLFVGALRYYKGLEYAIRAVAGTGMPLVIAGSGNEKKRLVRLVRKLNATEVVFLGSVTEEQKVLLLRSCRGFVFPSHLRSEAFGISLLEAAAHGKPLISCEIYTGTSYVNLHEVTGLVTEPANANQLRDAMKLIFNNQEVADAMGAQARKRAIKMFTLRKQGEAYKSIYEDVGNCA